MSKLPVHMSADEIVAEIKRLHDDVEHAAYRMGELCRLLLLRSRSAASRTAADEPQRPPSPGQSNLPVRRQETRPSEAQRIASANIVYANAWLRLSGLVSQAVRRTKIADRSLETDKRDVIRDVAAEAKEAAAKAARAERREERQEARRGSGQSGHPIAADLMELYGKEILDDAARR